MAAQRFRILKSSLWPESISAAHAFDMPGPTKPAAIHLYPYPHTCRTKQSFASIRPLLTFPSMQGSVRFPQVPRCQDRKSTRLNSSHLVISYAVFCLKKKTITH